MIIVCTDDHCRPKAMDGFHLVTPHVLLSSIKCAEVAVEVGECYAGQRIAEYEHVHLAEEDVNACLNDCAQGRELHMHIIWHGKRDHASTKSDALNFCGEAFAVVELEVYAVAPAQVTVDPAPP